MDKPLPPVKVRFVLEVEIIRKKWERRAPKDTSEACEHILDLAVHYAMDCLYSDSVSSHWEVDL